MNAPTPMPEPYELYRVVLDYEALVEGILDRIEDLNVPLEQVDMSGGFTRGNAQKLLNRGKSRLSRTFGWDSLGKMLKGTGLALVLVTDDERFAPVREMMTQRKRPSPSIRGKTQEKPINIEELMKSELQSRMREIGMKGNKSPKRRAKMMARRARQQKASHAARKRWSKERNRA